MIKTYPELNLAAIKQKQTRQLRLWYLLRALDQPQGGGRLHWRVAQEALADVISYESFRRALRDGEGVFWTVRPRRDGGQWVVLRGLAKVCWDLDVLKLYRTPTLVPIERCHSMGEFRAFIHNAWHSQENANPISRQAVNGLSGAAKSTQNRYDKKMDIKTTQNREVTGRISADGRLPEHRKEQGYYTLFLDGHYREVKHLPNSYYVEMPKAPRGRIRQTNRELQSRLVGREKEVFERRYFRSHKSFRRCKRRSETCFLLTGEYERGMLWGQPSTTM